MTLPAAPERIRWLVDVLGPDMTLRLLERRAGTSVYVPHRAQSSWLAVDLGLDLARKFSQTYGGEFIDLPLVKAWRVEMYRFQGFTHAAIAIKLGITTRSVRRYLHEAGQTDPDNALDTTERQGQRPKTRNFKAGQLTLL